MRWLLPLLVVACSEGPGGVLRDGPPPSEGSSPGTPVVLAGPVCNVGSLAASETRLYWADGGCGETLGYDMGGVGTVEKTGGTWTWIARYNIGAITITSDTQSVYWADLMLPPSSTIYRLALPDGSASSIASSEQVSQLRTDGAMLYWWNSQSVRSMPVGGGTPTTFATVQNLINGMAVDGSGVFVAVCAGSGAQIQHLPAGTQVGTTSAGGSLLALDGNDVYFAAYDGVHRFPKSGGPGTMILPGQTAGLAVDDTYVYVSFTGDAADLGRIVRVSKSGGAPTDLATGQNAPGPLLVDAAAIYWANGPHQLTQGDRHDGAIMKLPK